MSWEKYRIKSPFKQYEDEDNTPYRIWSQDPNGYGWVDCYGLFRGLKKYIPKMVVGKEGERNQTDGNSV